MRLLLCFIALFSATTLFGQTHFNLLEAKVVTVLPGQENGAVSETSTFVMVCQTDDVKMVGFDINKQESLTLAKGDTLKVQITTQESYQEKAPSYYGNTKRLSTMGSVYVNGMPVSCSIPPGVLTDEVGGGRVVAIFHYDTPEASFFFGVEDFTDREFIALP